MNNKRLIFILSFCVPMTASDRYMVDIVGILWLYGRSVGVREGVWCGGAEGVVLCGVYVRGGDT